MQFNVAAFPKSDGQYLVVARSDSLIFEASGKTLSEAEATLQRSMFTCFDSKLFKMMITKQDETLTRIRLEKNNASV